MTVEQIKEAQLAEAQARKNKRIEDGRIARYNNTRLMDTMIDSISRTSNINRLTSISTQLSLIPAQRVSTLGEVKVNVFPVAERYFGEELSKLLGIINAVRSTFLESQRDQALAITGLSMPLVEDLVMALGEPAYFSKKTGTVVHSMKGDYELARAMLEEVADTMGLDSINISKFDKAKYDLWFLNSENNANEKYRVYHDSLRMDAESSFTLSII